MAASDTPAESVASTTESSSTTTTTTGSLTGIRRQRASYSCRSCRARRVKCDQVHPTCENCRKNGIVCVYPENTPKRAAQTFGEPPVVNNRATRRRTEGGVRPRLGYLSLQSGGRSRYLENTFWATVDEDNLELDSLISELPLFPLDSYCCAAGQATNGEKRQHTAQCRHYVGTVEPNFAFWVSEGGAEGLLTCRTLAKILEELPTKTTCDAMFATFLEGVHPLIPLLHLPSFNDHYKEFWSWYENWDEEEVPEGVLAETPSFLPLLFAILFTAAFTCNGFENVEPNDSTQPEGLQTKLYRLTLSSLALVGFPQNPAIYSLCAFILAQNMLIREEESLSCSSFISVAFRISQAMGIHRDGSLFGLNPIQTEIRRRIWWHLMHNDVMVSTVSGLPPFILNEGYFDTQVPGEVKDELIGQTREGPNKDNDSYWLWPPYVLTVGRYQATDCIRSIVKRHFALVPITSKDVRTLRESIDNLVERLKTRMEKLKALYVEEHSPFDPSQTSPMPRVFRAGSQSLEAFLGWSEAIFHILIGRAYCLLYQPLMRDPTLWPEFRDEAIPKIQAFMRTFINMCSSPAYRPYQWLYPGSWQPLQPTAALLIDMRKHPTSNDARESRIILDMLFSLLGPEGRITAGEGHVNVGQRYMASSTVGAWSLLDKLRKKVWRQLGLDSSVMWSRGLSESSDDPNNVQNNSNGLTGATQNTTVTDDASWTQSSISSFLDPVTTAGFDPFNAFAGADETFGGGGFGSEFAPATDPTFDMSNMAGGLEVNDFNPHLPEMWNAPEWTQWPRSHDGYPQH